MSITPTAIIRSVSPRPYAHTTGLSVAAASVAAASVGFVQHPSFDGSWVCCDHMSTEHNPTTANTTGSKRLGPGSFVGVLT